MKKKRNKDVNFNIRPSWYTGSENRDYTNYVIFEYDTRPTGKRSVDWYSGGINWEYRSADDYYDKQTVYNPNFSLHSINNNCIEWNSEYK